MGEPPDWLALLESGVNDLVFSALAIWFLMMLPARLERARMLALLHRLRSVAHVIDMHQLVKVPERLPTARPEAGGTTSPAHPRGPGAGSARGGGADGGAGGRARHPGLDRPRHAPRKSRPSGMAAL